MLTATFGTRIAQSRQRMTVLDRTYKRDKDGQFASGGGGGVRDSLANAGTVGEVASAAAAEAKRITGRDIPFDYQDIEPQLAREYSEGVLRGLERFPGAPLGAVRAAEFPAERGEDQFTWAHTVPPAGTASGQYEIEFNRNGEVAQRANEILNLKQARGQFAYGDVQGLALHEFGHVMHEHYDTSYKASKLADDYADKHVPAPTPEPGKRKFGVGPRQPGELTEEQIREHRDEKRIFLLNEVSFYSQYNSHEFAAEAFTDVMSNGEHASPLSHQVMDLLEANVKAGSG